MKTKLELMMKKLVGSLIQRERREWPPSCPMFLYQPKRPVEDSQADKSNRAVTDRLPDSRNEVIPISISGKSSEGIVKNCFLLLCLAESLRAFSQTKSLL